MKSLRIPHFLLFSVLAFHISACKSFLDLTPTDAFLADDAIYNAPTSRALINSGYTTLKQYAIESAMLLGIVPGDNIYFAGSRSYNIELNNHAFTVENSAIVDAYRNNYVLINKANWAISEIPKISDPSFAPGEQDQLTGEAYFLRAYAYFNLARSWGGVQLQLSPTTDMTALGRIERSSLEETYEQVLADLAAAEQLLPQNTTLTRNLIQRPTVRAFRAKVALYSRDFDLAEAEASSIIADPNYQLTVSYANFYQAPYLSSESIFELSATVNDPGTPADPWLPASGLPRGSYEFRPTNDLITLLQDPQVGGERHTLLGNRNGEIYGALYHSTNPNLNPAYLLRLADLYLIRAEARVRKSSPDIIGARADLETIRSRAGLLPISTTLNSSEEILKAIWNERRLEFALEADRWYDLVRTERATEVLGVQQNYWLFPIPQADVLADIDLFGRNNPGY